MIVINHTDEAAALLEAHPEYRVLRLFRERDRYAEVIAPAMGLFVDTETTGLNTDEDLIIQFAAVKFEYGFDGTIGRVVETFAALEDPGRPLHAEVVALTGLTDSHIAGQRVDDGAVARLLEDVELVVAHNADFDRRIIERRFRGFNALPWACSQRDVDWKQFDCQYAGLEYLLMKACREFFLPHDALDDCRVGLHVLSSARDEEGRTAFAQLLEASRQPTYRVWARRSPFETKERLKARRYRWDADAKCWRKDVREAERALEIAWLTENIYAGDMSWAQAIDVTTIDARDRYSVRA